MSEPECLVYYNEGDDNLSIEFSKGFLSGLLSEEKMLEKRLEEVRSQKKYCESYIRILENNLIK